MLSKFIKSNSHWIAASALLLITSIACNAEAQRIREMNRGLANPAAEETPISAEIASMQVEDGDCINSSLSEGVAIATVIIVPCEGEWQYRVLNSFHVDEVDSYPSEEEFDRQALKHCDRRYSDILFPDSLSWRFGERTINCLQSSFGLSVIDPGKLDRLVSSDSLLTGECFNESPETEYQWIELVHCKGEWELRLLSSFDVPSIETYPGDLFFSQQAFVTCDRRFSTTVNPSEESWDYGDRTILCLQHSFGLHDTNPPKLDRLVRMQSLSIGSCFNEAPETNYALVELVSCPSGWQLRVVSKFTIDGVLGYPGGDYIQSQASEKCGTGRVYFYGPTQETWAMGDRTVTCAKESD